MPKVPFLEKTDIWQAADGFRTANLGTDSIPVDVLQIVEFGLKVDIIPIGRLRDDHDIDALFLRDWTALIVDLTVFQDERFENRLRYSIAHELGHYVLHRETHQEARFQTVEEWAGYIRDVNEMDYSRIEFQAYEFAGRLLVPRKQLEIALTGALAKGKAMGASNADLQSEAAKEYVASSICRAFRVSSQVMSKRLSSEELWPPTI